MVSFGSEGGHFEVVVDPVSCFCACVVDCFDVHFFLFFDESVKDELFDWAEAAFFEPFFFVDDEFCGDDEFEFSFLDFYFLSAVCSFGVFDSEEVPVEVHGVEEEFSACGCGWCPFASPSDACFFAEVGVFALHVVDFFEVCFAAGGESFFKEEVVECLVEVSEVELFFEDGFPFSDF